MAAQLVLSRILTAWWHWLSTEDLLLKSYALVPETASVYTMSRGPALTSMSL